MGTGLISRAQVRRVFLLFKPEVLTGRRYIYAISSTGTTLSRVTTAESAGHSFAVELRGALQRVIPKTLRSLPQSTIPTSALDNLSTVPMWNGLDSIFGVRAGTSPRHTIHFCVGINLGSLRQGGLYCYLDLQVALEKKIKAVLSKAAQVVLVEDKVLPEVLCVACRHPRTLSSLCLPPKHDLVKLQGSDAGRYSDKQVGKICKAPPAVRPTSSASSLSLGPLRLPSVDEIIMVALRRQRRPQRLRSKDFRSSPPSQGRSQHLSADPRRSSRQLCKHATASSSSEVLTATRATCGPYVCRGGLSSARPRAERVNPFLAYKNCGYS